MSDSQLPEQFAELETFVARWCLATEQERYARRMESSMDEMKRLYDAMSPRLEEIMNYCDQYPLDAMPDEAVRLLHLMYSYVNVSFPVEVWGQPEIPECGGAHLDRVGEPAP